MCWVNGIVQNLLTVYACRSPQKYNLHSTNILPNDLNLFRMPVGNHVQRRYIELC